MKTASIALIGNELLSGRTQDKNLQFMAKQFSLAGIALKEARIVGDTPEAIISTVNHLRNSYHYVVTTGGIGPTHDDITAQSIAQAFELPLEPHPEAYQRLLDFYRDKITPERARMANMPRGCSLIGNPLTAAPGFCVENVFCLAGVPEIMQAMFDFVLQKMEKATPFQSKTLTCPYPESKIATWLQKVQESNPQVEIGSYPAWTTTGHQVSLVVRGVDTDRIEAALAQLREGLAQLKS